MKQRNRQRNSHGKAILQVLSIAFLQVTAAACGDLPDSALDDEPTETSEDASEACNFSKRVNGTAIGDVDISYKGPIYTMESDPTSGGVNVASHCLAKVNEYRDKKGLVHYGLKVLTNQQKCCLIAEAKAAAEHGVAHFVAGCLPGYSSQGAAGGPRGETGSVEASINWTPRMFYEEGPSGGHYQAMMRPAKRDITCSFYAINRESHSILINWY